MAQAILHDNWGEKYTQGVMLDMKYDAGINPLIEKLENRRAKP